MDPSLITGLNFPFDIATSGSNLFVVNEHVGSTPNSGSIGVYTLSGQPVNSSLISGLAGPEAIAIFGSHLYVAESFGGRISQYTTSGVLVNSSLIAGLQFPQGIAVSADGTN